MFQYDLDSTGYLMPTAVSIPLSKIIRTHCTVRVNRQRCTAQGELLLQTVLTGQSAWHDTLQGPREWVRQYHGKLELNGIFCNREKLSYWICAVCALWSVAVYTDRIWVCSCLQLNKYYIWSIALCGAEHWTLLSVIRYTRKDLK